MSHSSAAVRPLSAPALWGLLAALYLVWPAVGLPSFLLSALSALVPLPLLFAFDSLLFFAVFYVGMGLLLQLAAGRRPTWRMALTAVLAALGLVLAQALVSDLSGLFLSADSGFMAVAALSLVNNLVRLAGMALVLRQVPDVSRYGRAVLTDGMLTAFNEKTSEPAPGTINGGVYLLEKRLIQEIPEGKVSLELEMIPRWLGEHRRLGGFVNDGYFIDIGIPEDYFRFEKDVEKGVLAW